jgi:serine protease Do
MSRWWRFALGCAVILAAGGVLAASPESGPSKGKQKSFRFLGMQTEGGYLGVVIKDLDGAAARGARVESVRGESPAAKAGLEEGDVVVRFDGEAVRSAEQLRRLVRETPPGREVAITVTRNGTEQKLTATLDKGQGDMAFELAGPDGRWPFAGPPMPPEPPLPGADVFNPDDGGPVRRMHREFGPRWRTAPPGPHKLGIQFQEISGQLAKYFKVEGGSGILVVSVDENGPAAKAGLKAGDLITGIAGKPVKDGEDVRREVEALDSGKKAAVSVLRDGRPLELEVMVGGEKPRPDASSTT